MPAGLIEDDDGVCTRGHFGCDLVEMEYSRRINPELLLADGRPRRRNDKPLDDVRGTGGRGNSRRLCPAIKLPHWY